MRIKKPYNNFVLSEENYDPIDWRKKDGVNFMSPI